MSDEENRKPSDDLPDISSYGYLQRFPKTLFEALMPLGYYLDYIHATKGDRGISLSSIEDWMTVAFSKEVDQERLMMCGFHILHKGKRADIKEDEE